MSDQNNLSEESTLEMETKENFNKILNAISEMREDFTNQFDKLNKKVEKIEAEQVLIRNKVEKLENEFYELKNFVDVQFEAVRQGIVQNLTQYNQIISEISHNRSAIFSTKAEVLQMQEKLYSLEKNMSQPI